MIFMRGFCPMAGPRRELDSETFLRDLNCNLEFKRVSESTTETRMRDTILDRLVLGVILAAASTIGAGSALFALGFFGIEINPIARMVVAFCGAAIVLAIVAPSRKVPSH